MYNVHQSIFRMNLFDYHEKCCVHNKFENNEKRSLNPPHWDRQMRSKRTYVNTLLPLAGGLIKQTTAAADWSIRLQRMDWSQGAACQWEARGSPRVLTDIDVKIGGDGSCSYQFRVAGWSAAAGPVWLPSWMLLSTLQVTQASLTTTSNQLQQRNWLL